MKKEDLKLVNDVLKRSQDKNDEYNFFRYSHLVLMKKLTIAEKEDLKKYLERTD